MDRCLNQTLRQHDHFPLFSRIRTSGPKPNLNPKPNNLIIMAKKKPVIQGLSDELNKIASQNLDLAPARRLVRSAFTQIQQNLDHCLFQVLFFIVSVYNYIGLFCSYQIFNFNIFIANLFKCCFHVILNC